MYEKVNPSHPDKIADRIAGALIDLAYKQQEDPKIAVEVLIGHGKCSIIAETSVSLNVYDVAVAVHRIAKDNTIEIDYKEYRQDVHLAENQASGLRCGDNGIFKGEVVTEEQKKLSEIAHEIYAKYPYDGKYILDGDKLIICQSHADEADLRAMYPHAIINPLGYWTGGIDADSGATNRKLGSDAGDSVTGGGYHGKDCSKADVSANILAWVLAQAEGNDVAFSCAIGDNSVAGMPYEDVVKAAKEFIRNRGGFEKFAEWGFI